jgi:beta-galactosidase
LDACGFKKPQSYYRDVVWGKSKLEMMVHQPMTVDSFEYMTRWGWPLELPYWTWPGTEGKNLKVNVYTTCNQVRLELNGKPLATKTLTEADKITLSFEVPYTAGTLKAIGLEDGKEVVVKEYKTVGKPARILLTPDRKEISANINDLSYVKVEIVDNNGIPVPITGKNISLSVEGDGELAAAGNGNPTEMQSFHQNKTTSFHGKCLAIVRPLGMKGIVKLIAEADGLEGASLEIRCK